MTQLSDEQKQFLEEQVKERMEDHGESEETARAWVVWWVHKLQDYLNKHSK